MMIGRQHSSQVTDLEILILFQTISSQQNTIYSVSIVSGRLIWFLSYKNYVFVNITWIDRFRLLGPVPEGERERVEGHLKSASRLGDATVTF